VLQLQGLVFFDEKGFVLLELLVLLELAHVQLMPWLPSRWVWVAKQDLDALWGASRPFGRQVLACVLVGLKLPWLVPVKSVVQLLFEIETRFLHISEFRVVQIVHLHGLQLTQRLLEVGWKVDFGIGEPQDQVSKRSLALLLSEGLWFDFINTLLL